MDTVTLSFGKALAGKQIKLRFRIASDGYVGDYGWDIDDVNFQGIVGTPFPAPVPSQKVCNAAPIANAGTNAQASSQAPVSLDASKSSDPDGDALTFTWTQLQGPRVELDDANSMTPAFVTPGLAATTTFTFQVTASDGIDTAVDTVDIIVEASPIVAGGGACTFVAPGQTTSSPFVLGAFVGLAAWARRRRQRSNRFS
jgi:MYXO-CTERM domain-containing protein